MTERERIGWIGVGRMGYPMAERLLKAGHSVAIWNRTKSKADPLAKLGGLVKESCSELGDVDVLFTIVSEGKDLEEVYFGERGALNGRAKPNSASIALQSRSTIPRASVAGWPNTAWSLSRLLFQEMRMLSGPESSRRSCQGLRMLQRPSSH